MKYLFSVSLCALVSCQKYVCHCEGNVAEGQTNMISASQEEVKKSSYGRAEVDCIEKGYKIGQKCYILMD